MGEAEAPLCLTDLARTIGKIGRSIMTPIGTEPQPITQLLNQLRAGDESAREELMDIVYATLHQIAKSHLRKERAGHTLQPTALVNEAYLKLFGRSEIQFVDRAHFFAIVSRGMRRILVDHARARTSGRRNREHVSLVPDMAPAMSVQVEKGDEQVSLLDLDLALDALIQENRLLAELIEMRYFGGMTAEETAEVLGRSVHAIRHDLRLAHAWLRRELAGRP